MKTKVKSGINIIVVKSKNILLEENMKTYNYFNGDDWVKVDEKWLDGVNLNGLREIYAFSGDAIRCVYKNGKEVFYKRIFGTWGNPTVFR